MQDTTIMLFAFFALVVLTSCATQEEKKENSPIFPDEKYITDFIPIDSKYSFFFWLFFSRDLNPSAPLVLWLQGGPGTSGVEVALFENGPYRIDDDLTVRRVPYSLNQKADVIYVDQPIGTGFSTCKETGRMVVSEQEVARDLYQFLLGFMKKYPQYKGRPMYIAGQSFAGHFIPGAIPIIMEKHNKDINIKGLAIGNAHTSPYVQFPEYAEFAYKKGLINTGNYITVKGTLKLCQYYLSLGTTFISMIELYCTGSFLYISGPPDGYRFNIFDVRKKCIDSPGCYNFKPLINFMKKPEVLKELNVGNREWKISNLDIIKLLRVDYWLEYGDGITYFLNKKIPVVLFYGKEDFVCSYLGGIATIKNLKWSGASELINKPYQKWVVDGKTMGEYKHHDKLTYIEMEDAGHMATMDHPRAGIEIIDILIKGGINEEQQYKN